MIATQSQADLGHAQCESNKLTCGSDSGEESGGRSHRKQLRLERSVRDALAFIIVQNRLISSRTDRSCVFFDQVQV